MTEPLTHIDAASAGTAAQPLGVQLRTRVVREARRETWFVVNEGTEDLAVIPLELRADAALRRVDINGEVTEFTAEDDEVLVRLRRPLRPGGGTIVALHFR